MCWNRCFEATRAKMRPLVALRNAVFIVALLVFLVYYYTAADLSAESALEHLQTTARAQHKYPSVSG